MGFDSEYRRRVLERWKQANARTRKRVVQALRPRPGVSLGRRLQDALAVIVSHGKRSE